MSNVQTDDSESRGKFKTATCMHDVVNFRPGLCLNSITRSQLEGRNEIREGLRVEVLGFHRLYLQIVLAIL